MMADVKIKELTARYNKAKGAQLQWVDLLRDAYDFSQPNRNLFRQQAPGAKKMDRVFDSTAVISTIRFANRIQSDLIPPFQRWAKLKAGPMVPQEQREEADALLEGVTDILFAVIGSSNFDLAANELLLDLAVGTGAMLILEGDAVTPVVYITAPINQVFLEEGKWGTVSGIFRTHKVAIRNIKSQWPQIKTLPAELGKQLKDNFDAEVDLFDACYYNEDKGNWCYEVVWEKSEESLMKATYRVCPWATPRWIKVAGEAMGRGPVILALPDIKTLNKLTELVLKNASLHISGVYTGVNDGVLNPNTVVIAPGAVIPVASNGGTRGPSLMPLDRTGSFDLAQIQHEKLIMHIKQVLLDNALPPETGAVRSATEIAERIKELSEAVGSPFSRLLKEFIQPVIARTLDILERRGMVPKIKVDGLGVAIQVVSPLAQLQNAADVEGVIRWLSILASFGQEQAMLSAKMEDMGEWLGHKIGVPLALIRGESERKQMMEMAGKAAAMNAQGGPPGTAPSAELIGTGTAAAGIGNVNRMAA